MERHNMRDYGMIRFERLNPKELIPFLGGRPEREKLINNDDQLNLKIALETAKDFEEFLNLV